MEKCLFIDCDGVLNNQQAFLDQPCPDPLAAECIKLCREVLWKTGARAVLSSTWRRHPASCRKVWNALHTADRFVTPVLESSYPRGNEIKAFLDRHPEFTRYAIVDDDDDMLPEQFPFFVKTNFKTGLTRADADCLIAVLGRGPHVESIPRKPGDLTCG